MHLVVPRFTICRVEFTKGKFPYKTDGYSKLSVKRLPQVKQAFIKTNKNNIN
jgi:hypothetical protein